VKPFLEKPQHETKNGVGDITTEFINVSGCEGDHETPETVQGGHAQPALCGQVRLYAGGSQHVGISCD